MPGSFCDFSVSPALQAGWVPGQEPVIVQKVAIRTQMRHAVIYEDGRNPFDVALWIQADEGTLFPLIDVQGKKLALQVRFRPQLKDGVDWKSFVANWPDLDLSLLGKDSLTVHRWFGGKGAALEEAVNGTISDPRLTIVRRPHVVANDALEVHSTHMCYGLVERGKASASNALGQALDANLHTANIHWKSLDELRRLREAGQLACGFTNSIIGDILMCRPDLLS